MPKDPAQVDAALHLDDHDLGLAHDMPRLIGRRRMLALMAATGAGAVAGGPAFAQGHCVREKRESVAPFPAGNQPLVRQAHEVLDDIGVIRSDMRSGFAGMAHVAHGVRLDFELELVSADASCAPLGGCAIYLWHCDAKGRYSLYDIKDSNYLRAVGVVGADGKVAFTTIFPGCYTGRWPHIHFEVFKSVIDAVSGAPPVLVSQWAFSDHDCRTIYGADARYADGLKHLSRMNIHRDAVFRIATDRQRGMQTMQMTGTPATGYKGRLRIPISAPHLSAL